MSFVKLEFMAELLYCIAIIYPGEPNKVTTEIKKNQCSVKVK